MSLDPGSGRFFGSRLPTGAATVHHLHPQAAAAAQRAATEAGVVLVEAVEMELLTEVAALLDGIWSPGNSENVIPADLLRAMTYAGNPVLAALIGDQVVGATAGFLGRDGGRIHLHSHVAGVMPDVRSRRVGYALKLSQRAWALERDIETVVWTYDPLLGANARFNLSRLAAEGARYHVDFYGTVSDAFQNGEETDRVEVAWDLVSERVVAASEGTPHLVEIADLETTGASVILDQDSDGGPNRGEIAGATTLLARIPQDTLELRRRDPSLAREWLMATREMIGGAMGRGFRITGLARSGWYVLERQEGNS